MPRVALCLALSLTVLQCVTAKDGYHEQDPPHDSRYHQRQFDQVPQHRQAFHGIFHPGSFPQQRDSGDEQQPIRHVQPPGGGDLKQEQAYPDQDPSMVEEPQHKPVRWLARLPAPMCVRCPPDPHHDSYLPFIQPNEQLPAKDETEIERDMNRVGLPGYPNGHEGPKDWWFKRSDSSSDEHMQCAVRPEECWK